MPEDVGLYHTLNFWMTLWSKVHLTILDDYMSEEREKKKKTLESSLTYLITLWSSGYNSLILP